MQTTSTDTPPTHQLDTNSVHVEEPKHQSPTHDAADNSLVRDVILWKRKNLSVVTLSAATAIWVALELYGLTFITLLSWIAMLIITFIFFWGNIHRLLGKEPLQDMANMYISEESAVEMGTKAREYVEKSLRLLLSVGAERDWFVFAGTIASLGLLSVVATYLDFLTLLYIGVIVGLTVPVVYVKYEDKIKEFGQRGRDRCHKYYTNMEELVQKMKSKLQKKKQKKAE